MNVLLSSNLPRSRSTNSLNSLGRFGDTADKVSDKNNSFTEIINFPSSSTTISKVSRNASNTLVRSALPMLLSVSFEK